MPTSSWRCCPCDSAATGWWPTDSSRTCRSSSAAADALGSEARGRCMLKRPRVAPRTARKRLSSTDSSRNSSDDWYVRRKPRRMRSCGGSWVMSSPKNWTRPAVGGKSPVMALNKVVLPAPLAPRIARRSPAGTAKLMSSIARKAPNCRVTRSSTSASPDSAAETGCAAKGSSTTEAITRRIALRAVGHVA